MGVFEVINKHNEELEEILEGLGMAGASDKHQDFSNALSGYYYNSCLNKDLLIGSEYRNEKNKNNTEIADVIIKDFYNDNRLCLIEICTQNTDIYLKALKRINEFYKKHKTLKEAFVIKLEKNGIDCETVKRNGEISKGAYSFLLNDDLEKTLKRMKIYNKYY